VADTYVQPNDANNVVDGTGALTLAEAAKLEKDTFKQGIMEMFANVNPILSRLPFLSIEGNSYEYDYEKKLPAVGFRSVNEGYAASHGQTDKRSVGLAIAGGDLDVDKFIIQTRGSKYNQRAVQEAMQTKALSLKWLKTFFDGNRATSGNEEFDGLNVLLGDAWYADKDVVWANTSTNGVSAWDTSDAGSPLLEQLDEAIDNCIGEPDMIVCNKTVRRFITRIAKKDGQIAISPDRWGWQQESYRNIPLIVVEDDNEGNAILGFDETAGSDTETTSAYVLKLGADEYVSGLQNGGMDVRDIGELETKPSMRTRVEWYTSLAIFHPRAAQRIAGIKKTFAQS
jgi:hypothetical protein